jgi:hypothetical protein
MRIVAALGALWLLAGCGNLDATQTVTILEPSDGAVVTSPFTVRFGVKGMVVAPAGDIVANSGHHHLLVNMDALPTGEVVPVSDRHIHLGKGQNAVELTLPPGRYKLTAQFANGAHQSYGVAMSRTITVTVR